MLSLTSEYALRAMVYLARHIDDWPIPGRTIAEKAKIPRRYLSSILGDLARVGILHASPGAGGGFRMVHSPEEVMLSELVAPFERIPTNCRPCPFGKEEACEVDLCAAHERWGKVREAYSQFLEGTSLYDAAIRRRNRRSSGSPKRTKR